MFYTEKANNRKVRIVCELNELNYLVSVVSPDNNYVHTLITFPLKEFSSQKAAQLATMAWIEEHFVKIDE